MSVLSTRQCIPNIQYRAWHKEKSQAILIGLLLNEGWVNDQPTRAVGGDGTESEMGGMDLNKGSVLHPRQSMITTWIL